METKREMSGSLPGRLADKVALISGAARGQGAAEARLFANEGARVVLGDVLDDEGKAVAAALGDDTALYVHLDVTRPEDWEAAVAAGEGAFGKLDVLVNNAGIVRFNKLEDTSLEEFMDVVRVNQVGTFLGMKAAVPAMRRAGGGSIVNIASIDGVVGMSRLVSYAATKFAVRGMTRVAALELARDGIRVNAVCPGGVDTAMSRPRGLEDVDLDQFHRGVPLRRIGRPEEIAALVLFLASDESAYCTGADFVIDGGILAGLGTKAFTG